MEPRASRRRLLRALAAGAAGGLAGCGGDPDDTGRDGATSAAGTPGATTTGATATGASDGGTASGGTGETATAGEDGSPEPTPEGVGVETIASGLSAPVDVAFAPDADRRYVAEQPGRIRVHGPDGFRPEPLLDLRDAVVAGGERGLLGIALHPEFADDPRLYVRYSASPREGTPDDYSHTFVLSEFAVGDDGLRADPDGERTILEVPEPQGNHNAGDLAFGPEGMLYVAVGDGGAGGDRGRGHVGDWYGAVPGGNGQDVTENLLGSILRIGVDGEAGGAPSDRGASAANYAVPESNPLVGRDGLEEHYAWGLRNPWRFSIDPEGELVEDGPDLLVGDVGQRRYEEVDVVAPGGNYGWNVREGRHCFGAESCPDATPGDVRGGEPLLDPVVEYPHGGAPVSGISVIGGVVYRGDVLPDLRGRYVFGDWEAGGQLFVADREGDRWPTSTLPVEDGPARLRSFAPSPDGELYLVEGGRSARLLRVVPG